MSTSVLITIVEDDQIVRDALEDLVQSLGYSAAAFASAEEYLLTRLFPVTSCLISDLHLPGMSGADLQDKLIAQGRRIPVIFITAGCNDAIRARVLKHGALGVLPKPFDESILVKYLEQAVQKLKCRAATCHRVIALGRT
jgi:FixJ family two-component response regulator